MRNIARLKRLLESERERVKAEGITLSREWGERVNAMTPDERIVYYRWWYRRIETCNRSDVALAQCGGSFEVQPGDDVIEERVMGVMTDDFCRKILDLADSAERLGVDWEGVDWYAPRGIVRRIA